MFTTDGSLPARRATAPPTRRPITIGSSTQVRAATISGNQPPAIATENYVRLAADLQDYSSPLPILIVENYGAGTIPNKGWSTNTQTGAGLQQPAQAAGLPADRRLAIRTTETADHFGAEPQTDLAHRHPSARRVLVDLEPQALLGGDLEERRRRGPRCGARWGCRRIPTGSSTTRTRTTTARMLYNTFIWELARADRSLRNSASASSMCSSTRTAATSSLSDRRGVYAFAEKVKRGRRTDRFRRALRRRQRPEAGCWGSTAWTRSRQADSRRKMARLRRSFSTRPGRTASSRPQRTPGRPGR